MILTTRPATVADAEWIGANLRADDQREVEASTGRSGLQAVPFALSVSQECYTFRLTTAGKPDERPAVIFGVCDSTAANDLGVIWLLATPAIQRAPLSILREAGPWLDHFGRRYSAGLHTIADIRNDLHIRWLQLTGFTLASRIEIRGQTFQHAIRSSHV